MTSTDTADPGCGRTTLMQRWIPLDGHGSSRPYSLCMVAMTIKSTYSLDAESVRALDDLARRQQVSKSEALRRAIRNEARRQPAQGEDAVAALDQLQASLSARDVGLELWARDVEAGRQAAARLRAT